MKGFEFIERYLSIMKRMRVHMHKVSKAIFSNRSICLNDYMILSLGQVQIPLLYEQKLRLIVLSRGGGFEVQQDIVDHAYDIVYLCVSIASRLEPGDLKSDMEYMIADYFLLLSNAVNEETHENMVKQCYIRSDLNYCMFAWEPHNKYFCNALDNTVHMISDPDYSSMLWQYNAKKRESGFCPEKYLAIRMNEAIYYAEKNDYIRAYTLLDEIVHGGITADKEMLSQSLYNLGEVFRNQKKFDEAMAFYQKAIDFYPDERIWVNMGVIHIVKGNWESAYDCIKKALDINPYDFIAIDNLMKCLLYMKKDDEFGAYSRKILDLYEKKPSDEMAERLGFIYYIKHDFKNAASFFGKSASENMDNAEYLYYYAMSLYHIHNTTKAILLLKNAVSMMEKSALDNRKYKLYATISYYYIDSPSLDRTVKSMEEYQEKYGSEEQLEMLNAVMFMDYQVADEYFQLIRAGMDFWENVGTSFDCRRFIEEIEERNKEWDRWICQTPRKMIDGDLSALTRKLLIQSYLFECAAYEQLQEYGRAYEMCENVLYWDESSPEALYHKGFLAEVGGKRSEALEYYEKALQYQSDEFKRADIENHIQEMDWGRLKGKTNE